MTNESGKISEDCPACLELNPNNVRKVYTRGLCKAHGRQTPPLVALRIMDASRKCEYVNPDDGECCGREHSAFGLCKAHADQKRAGKELHSLKKYAENKPTECKHINSDGTVCRNTVRNSGYCVSHERHIEKFGYTKDIKGHVKKTKTCVECGVEFTLKNAQSKLCSVKCRGSFQKSPLVKAVEAGDADLIFALTKERSSIDSLGCWVWQGSINYQNYPILSGLSKSRSYLLHRVVLEAKIGRELGKEQAHHTCANSQCVNPEHLQPVSQVDNLADMLQRNFYIRRIAQLEERERVLEKENADLKAQIDERDAKIKELENLIGET